MKPENMTILTVDDTPANIRLLTHYLKKKGYRVITAEDGFEGFKAAIQYHPDLVLLDIMMPGTDGYEVCELLKTEEETKDIPIVFLTAKTDVEDRIRGFELGAVDYITKPFNLTEIATRVQTQLRLKYLQEQSAQYQKFLIQSQYLANLGMFGNSFSEKVKDLIRELQEHLQTLQRNENHPAQKTVDGMLDITGRIDSVIERWMDLALTIPKEKATLRVYDIIESSLTIVEIFDGYAMNIKFVKSENSPSILGNENLLQHALINLYEYMVKYTKKDGTIEITVELGNLPKHLLKNRDSKSSETFVQIRLVNDGSRNKENILEEELDVTQSEKFQNGKFDLGLQATYRIVKEHKGILDIQIDQEKKLAISMYLPNDKS